MFCSPTGAKELAAFAGLDAARLYPRVLPTVAGITACEGVGIPHRNIIAMQGPFTLELNLALMQQFHIRYLVTKDGGSAGGFAEKARCRPMAGCAGCTAPPGGMRRDRRRNFATMQGAVMKITLVGMAAGCPAV